MMPKKKFLRKRGRTRNKNETKRKSIIKLNGLSRNNENKTDFFLKKLKPGYAVCKKCT